MKIAFVHDWLNGMRGGERCLEAMCELFPDADIYTLLHIPGSVSAVIERHKIITSRLQHFPWIKSKYRYYLPFMPKAIESFYLRGYDLVISSSHCVAKGARIVGHTPHLCYCYTPMRYVWDMHGQYFLNRNFSGMAMDIFRDYLKKWDVASSKRVGRFVAISETVQKRIKRCYNKDSWIIYPPVDTGRFGVSGREEDFYLIVSAFVPYKRVDIAIEAFNILGYPLKIVGCGPEEERLKKMARGNISFLGWLPDDQVSGLYSRCKALVFPGEEDFGIVPVEAMASGKPVLAFAGGGATETVIPYENDLNRPASGILFKEQTAEALIQAVRRFEVVKQVFVPEEIKKHAVTFDKSLFRTKFKQSIEEFLFHA
ncbi:MAG: glycosyltransferase [Candidatus Omnitrophota bacterium]